jgi:hypothetical protein
MGQRHGVLIESLDAVAMRILRALIVLAEPALWELITIRVNQHCTLARIMDYVTTQKAYVDALQAGVIAMVVGT